MTLTIYATQDDVEQIWSENGVLRRLDDDEDGSADANLMDGALERATVQMNKFLFKRYTPAVIAASTWAKWVCAYFAAYHLGIRRGNIVPKPIEDEYLRYLQYLQDIEQGKESLPADDGLAPEQFDNAPSVTNYTVDARYYHSKVRRIPSISTGGNQSSGLKQHNDNVHFPLDGS